MNTIDLKNHIKDKQLRKFYIFTGPEVKVRNLYIQQIANACKLKLRYIDSLEDLCRNARTKSLLSESFLIVIVDDMSILSDTKLQDVLERKETFKNDTIILVYNTIDKRTSFYKKYKSEMVEFEYLTDEILTKYIQKEINLNTANCKTLIEVCEKDYSRILLEVDKLKAFEGDVNTIFRGLLKDGTIYRPAKDAIFQFIDAVFMNKRSLAYQLLQESYDSGEATLVILSNLFTNAKYVLQAQSYTGNNLAQASGLTPFQIKLAKQRSGQYKNYELRELMHLVREAEVGIKIGRLEEQIAVKYVLANLWR